jgi:hypothetical protein
MQYADVGQTVSKGAERAKTAVRWIAVGSASGGDFNRSTQHFNL